MTGALLLGIAIGIELVLIWGAMGRDDRDGHSQ